MSVSALVYVAARAPDAGEDFGALAAKFPKPPASDGVVRANGFFWLSEEAFLREFARDLEPGRARTLYAVEGTGSRRAAHWKDHRCRMENEAVLVPGFHRGPHHQSGA